MNTTYVEDDDDVTALFVKVPDNAEFARYEMNFLEAAKSDVDSSSSYKLDDLEKKSVTMLGKHTTSFRQERMQFRLPRKLH